MIPAPSSSPAWREIASRFGLTRGAVAAIASLVSVGVAISLMTPLVSLTLAGRGISERTIGLIVASHAVAALAATPATAFVATRLPAGLAIAGLTLVAALLIPLVWFVERVGWLFPILFLYGGCVSLCFTLSEFWITASTPPGRRGLVVGLYATLLSIGFAIGPAIVALLGVGSLLPFLIGSGLMLIAALPAFLARRHSPSIFERPETRFMGFVLAVPVATFGALVFAMGESGGFAFLPIWGLNLGLSASVAALLVSAMTLGNVAFQIPLGILADRADRRTILFWLAIVGALGIAAAWVVAEATAVLAVVLFIWGGATAGIYTVGLAHLAARFQGGGGLAGANAAFVFCYALGMLVGPAAIGEAMARAPVGGLPLVLFTAFSAYAALVAFRLKRRGPAIAAGPRR